MRTIGLTGGIGAGKSVISRMLRCMGYPVYDCDLEARRIMTGSEALKREIRERMGEECVTREGGIDRKALADHVFNDASKREWLNRRVHEMVRQDIRLAASDQTLAGSRLFFIESAILNTGKITPMVDAVWLVTATTGVRLARVLQRDKSDPESVLARMRAQDHEFDDFGGRPVARIVNEGDSELFETIEKLIKSNTEC